MLVSMVLTKLFTKLVGYRILFEFVRFVGGCIKLQASLEILKSYDV